MTPAPPQLKTRKPTGKVAYPLILLEGEEKAGKSFAALSLSASNRVGRTFILELDEPSADEYAALGDFEILEHNGTYTSMLNQLKAAAAVPMEDGKPNVIILDTGTALWNLIKRWVDHRARSSKKAQAILRDDPDAEIDTSMNLWNDAKDRWYAVIDLLRAWPGVGIVIARGKEVAKVTDGKPVANQTDYSVEAEKSTPFAVSAVVRMTRPHTATLMVVRKLDVDVPAKGTPLPDTGPLEHLVFDVLGAGDAPFQVSSAVSPTLGMTIGTAKTRLVEILKRAVSDEGAAIAEASAVWAKADLGEITEVNEEQFASVASLAAERIAELTSESTTPIAESSPDMYVCPQHIGTGGYEGCCECGGWEDGDPNHGRTCSEALEQPVQDEQTTEPELEPEAESEATPGPKEIPNTAKTLTAFEQESKDEA